MTDKITPIMEAACQGCRNIALDAAIKLCEEVFKRGGDARSCATGIQHLKEMMNNHRGPDVSF